MTPDRPQRFQSTRAIAVYFGLVFLSAAVVAPWVYLGVQSASSASSIFASLARQPFHRYVNRCLLLAAVASLPWLVRRCGIRTRADAGWTWKPGDGKQIWAGFGIAWLSLALVAAGAVLFGAREILDPLTSSRIVRSLFSAAGSAFVVAVLEETLFRGVLLNALKRDLPARGALLLSALVYSWVHFFERPPAPDSVGPWTGFWVLGQMCRGLVDPHALWPGFLSLFVVGVILGFSLLSTRSIWLGVGLHAGWIFWLKGLGTVTRLSNPDAATWWGGERLYDGLAALVVLVVAGILVRRWVAPTNPEP